MTTDTIEAVPVEAVKIAPVLPEVATLEPIPEDPADFVEVHGTRVDLLENSVKLHLSNGTSRIVSYSDFSQTLLSFLDKAQETKTASIRLLPPNVYAIEEGPSHLKLGFYFPEKIQNVNYGGKTLPRIVPNIIMTVSLTRGTGDRKNDFKYRQAQYFCTNLPLARLAKQIVLGPGQNIGVLPFTNVYQEGVLCTGGNSIIHDYPGNDLRQTIWCHDMLWASPFNNDLGIRALRNDSVYRDNYSGWYTYLAELAKKGEGFPYSELANMK